jgi:hypothetical protein
MKRFIVSVLVLSFTCFQKSGCSSLQPKFSTKEDMGIFGGSLSGVIIGGLVGNIPGALLGGMLGLAVGDAVGVHYDKKLGTREEALSKYKLKDKEEKLRVEASVIDPLNASVGATVKTSVTYTVIAAAEDKEMKITETRMLFNEKVGYLKLDERKVLRTQGTYSSTYKFTVPENISRGVSTVITVISTEKQTEKTSAELKIV